MATNKPFEYGQYVTYEGKRYMITNWEEDETQVELFSSFDPKRVRWVNTTEVTEHSDFYDPKR